MSTNDSGHVDKPGAIGRLAARLGAWRAEQRETRERVARANGGHPPDRGACDPEEACCDGCAAAYSDAWAEPDGDDGADVASDDGPRMHIPRDLLTRSEGR